MDAYQDQHAKVYQKLGKAKQMVLATSFEGRTTARTMSCVVLDGCFYFQTDKTFLKYGQMKGNPSVALCFDNMQIEGLSVDLGHPLAERNAAFAVAYQHAYPGSYAAYSGIETEVLFRVEPLRITCYEYENHEPVMKIISCKEESYHEFWPLGGPR
jgi:hypothetical protein